jgi:di/tricarboxylate transporter
MGQIGISVAASIGVSVDAMLIAVLIGASSDFLTPIGHQNNMLVMGPGGYRFGDYARVGAPLALIVIFVSAKMIELGFAG